MNDESVPPAAGRVFISYRREDADWQAGRLDDRLVERFGRDQIFKDVDSIQLGEDFVKKITSAVGSCDVLLALIGDQWLTITDEQGRARLDNPDDYVRLEIEVALTRDVLVIPILVGRAPMPRADQLPESLAMLVRRNALELSPSRFEFDTGRLLKVLERTLGDVRGQPVVAEPRVPVPTRDARVRALYAEAGAEMRLGHFQTAIDLFTDLLALDPNHRDATQLRDAATQQLFLADTYQRASDAEAASEWAEAVTAYSDILEADPTYRDAAARRKACEGRQQVSDLQGELRHHAAAAHWQAVLDVNAELAHLDPSAADPDGLATQAQQVLDEEQAQREAQEAARRHAQEQQAQREAQEAARRQAEEQARYDQPQYAQPVGQPPPPVRPPNYAPAAGAPGSQPRRKVLVAAAVSLLVVAAAVCISVVIVYLGHRSSTTGQRSSTTGHPTIGQCPTEQLSGSTRPFTVGPVTVRAPEDWVPLPRHPDEFSPTGKLGRFFMRFGINSRHPKSTMRADAESKRLNLAADPNNTDAKILRFCRFHGADAADLEYHGIYPDSSKPPIPVQWTGVLRIWFRDGTRRELLYTGPTSRWSDASLKLFYGLATNTSDR